MNKNVTKGLIVGALITGYFLYRYFKQENDALAKSYNEQLSLMENSAPASELVNKNEEFVELGDECILIGDVKAIFNEFIGTGYFDEQDIYNPYTRDYLKKILEGTNHSYSQTDGLRKMFLYDIVKVGANLTETDLATRPLKYEYSAGLISLGDKGNDVKELQELINRLKSSIYQVKPVDLIVNGTYDKATLQAVNTVFIETTALVDSSKGAISKEFVKNFTTILNNLENF
jgi:hypothetical protein